MSIFPRVVVGRLKSLLLQILPNQMANTKLLVVCGPSGSGKSTLIRKLFEDYPNKFGFSVSHTTRQPRPGEKDGVDYFFTTKDDILQRIDAGDFLESATFSGNVYGTSFKSVQNVSDSGKICLLDIDTEGVRQVKQKKTLHPLYIFIKPPSLEVLEKRLRNRGTENEESLAKRLAAADREMAYGATEGNFDAIVVNDDIEESYKQFKNIVADELHKRGIDITEN